MCLPWYVLGSLGEVLLVLPGMTLRRDPLLVGTPTMVADRMQDLFESACCDGFILCPSLTPSGYKSFCKAVVPELQRRGIFRTEYAGRICADHLREQ
jgi:alkanesulfonate monooxygenase SsuD/methylene tetrahydromethanopterin reductase-like flavin-dependent oxidoreductase (luciferase family)